MKIHSFQFIFLMRNDVFFYFKLRWCYLFDLLVEKKNPFDIKTHSFEAENYNRIFSFFSRFFINDDYFFHSHSNSSHIGKFGSFWICLNVQTQMTVPFPNQYHSKFAKLWHSIVFRKLFINISLSLEYS